MTGGMTRQTELSTADGFGMDKALKRVVFDNDAVSVALFTVTGTVIVRVIAVCEVVCASAAGCNGSVGIAAAPAAIIALTDLTLLAAQEIWHDNAPDAEIEALTVLREFIISDGNDIALALSAQADSGTVAFYCFWTPVSDDGALIPV